MLSGIQHFVFCKRQWVLIHIEEQWADNLRTIEGNILHQRAHEGVNFGKQGTAAHFPGDAGVFPKAGYQRDL